jgi:hypothetical protein
MKTYIFRDLIRSLVTAVILTMALSTAFGQERERQCRAIKNHGFCYKNVAPLSFAFLSGAADGFGDVLQFHYRDFKQVFPNANDQFWNPELSWQNKYLNGVPAQGPKFWGSTNVFVGTTDAWHATKTFRIATLSVAIATSPLPGHCAPNRKYRKGQSLKAIAFKTIAYSPAYGAGQWVTYSVIFSNKQ